MKQKGFTLVELLVVVTLIAILAVAVLATINPIEQRKKAVDTAVRNASAELLAAEERFFATYGCYTWMNSDLTDFDCGAAGSYTPPDTAALTTASLLLDQLESTGEVKQVLLDRVAQTTVPYNTMVLTEDADGIVHICFDPESTSYGQLANCTASADNGCDGTGTDPDFLCVPDSQF